MVIWQNLNLRYHWKHDHALSYYNLTSKTAGDKKNNDIAKHK